MAAFKLDAAVRVARIGLECTCPDGDRAGRVRVALLDCGVKDLFHDGIGDRIAIVEFLGRDQERRLEVIPGQGVAGAVDVIEPSFAANVAGGEVSDQDVCQGRGLVGQGRGLGGVWGSVWGGEVDGVG